MKIALVKTTTRYHVCIRRKWIPVYLPAHTDPEISASAANPHYHIAWNRMAASNWRGYSGVVVWVSDVIAVRAPKHEPSIIAPSHAVADWTKQNSFEFPAAWTKWVKT